MSELVISTGQTSMKLAPLRLNRRGRLIMLGIPALVISAALLFSLITVLLGVYASPANAATASDSVAMANYTSTVTVLQGESLWSIAAASDSSRDVRDVVADIVELNGLRTAVVQPGQQLSVPLPK